MPWVCALIFTLAWLAAAESAVYLLGLDMSTPSPARGNIDD